MIIDDYGIRLMDEDIEKIADCVNERAIELIDNHRPLDYEYVEYNYDVLSCDDRIMFKLIIVSGQPEITEAWLTYGDYDYCFGQINLDKINAKLTKI